MKDSLIYKISIAVHEGSAINNNGNLGFSKQVGSRLS